MGLLSLAKWLLRARAEGEAILRTVGDGLSSDRGIKKILLNPDAGRVFLCLLFNHILTSMRYPQ